MTEIELKPIRETTAEYDKLEIQIRKIFREEIYEKLMAIVAPKRKLQNAVYDLYEAIRSGRVTYHRGTFNGRFNSTVAKELKALGAKWDRAASSFKLPQSDMPRELKMVISSSHARFAKTLQDLDKTIAELNPAEIAGKLKSEKLFDTTLWKVDREFRQNIRNITVAPDLTPERRAIIAAEYTNNLKLYIQKWTEEEIVKLRGDVEKSAFAGNRYESIVGKIQTRYGQSVNKAKFLARQETALLMNKFKETRYTDAGVNDYTWGCVAGTKNHPVRPWHKALQGKKFRFDDPPVTTKPGEPVRRNNPGGDFNCRCFARPIVKF